MKLSIIIPCYNEANTIEAIVAAVKKASLYPDKEVIVVDDFFSDGT